MTKQSYGVSFAVAIGLSVLYVLSNPHIAANALIWLYGAGTLATYNLWKRQPPPPPFGRVLMAEVEKDFSFCGFPVLYGDSYVPCGRIATEGCAYCELHAGRLV
jgi:hypothetical protein